ncbi:MAG: O-antigen ligase family protein [Fuerstiella sp.]|nr:O-antigen ligase domain-containing protein [Fuerstiella sp.]
MSTAAIAFPVSTTQTRQHSPLWLPIAVACTLMALTFSINDDVPGGASLNALLSKVKYGARLVAIPVLAWICVRQCQSQKSACGLGAYVPFSCFVGWAILSTVWSPLTTFTFAQAGSLLTLCLLSCTFAVLCRTHQDAATLMRALCTALFLISTVLLLLKFLVPPLAVMTRDGTGLFHATNTACTAALGLVLLVASHILWPSAWSRRLLLPAILTHVLVLFLSANRLSVGLTLLIMGSLFARHVRPFYALLWVFCGCCSGALYLAVDPGFEAIHASQDAMTSYARRGQSADDMSAFSGREEMWQVMWESFRDSPWIGHGYFVTSRTGELTVWFKEGNWTAHNTLLQVLVSTGIVGTTLFVCGIIVLFAVAFWRNTLRFETPGISKLLVVIFFWFFCWGILNESIAGPLQPESVVFFSILGMALGRGAAAANTPRNDMITHLFGSGTTLRDL